MIEEALGAEISTAVKEYPTLTNKRKHQVTHTSPAFDFQDGPSQKRTPSRNGIFRLAHHDRCEDAEQREEIDDYEEDDELSLVNAYRCRDQENTEKETHEPLDLQIISSKEDTDYPYSPVLSFLHPALLRATTICESASDIFFGDPPEMGSRSCSPMPEGEISNALHQKKKPS